MKKVLILIIVLVVIIGGKLFANSFMDKVVGNGRSEWDKAFTDGNIFFNKKEYAKAIPFYDQSIAELKELISTKPSNRQFIFQVLISKASCHQELGEVEKAVSVYQEIIEESKQIEANGSSLPDEYIRSYIGTALINQGLINLDNKEELAREKFEEALDLLVNQKTIMPLGLTKDVEKVIKYYDSKNENEVSKKFEEVLMEAK